MKNKIEYCTKDNFINVICSLGIKSFDKSFLEDMFLLYSGNKNLLYYYEFIKKIINEKNIEDTMNTTRNNNFFAKSLNKFNDKLVYIDNEYTRKNNHYAEKPTHVFFNEKDDERVDYNYINLKMPLPAYENTKRNKKITSNPFNKNDFFKNSLKVSEFKRKEKMNITFFKNEERKNIIEISNINSKFSQTQSKKLNLVYKSKDTHYKTPENLKFISMYDSVKSIFETDRSIRYKSINVLTCPNSIPILHKHVQKTKSLNYYSPVENNLLKFRDKLFSRGGKTIFSLSKQFKIFDTNNDKTISFSEFVNAIKIFKIDLTHKESEELFKYFDNDGNGKIDYEEFLEKLIDEMNEKRYTLVVKIFNQIDRDKKGFIDLDTIKFSYDAKSHPDVISKKKKEEEILNEFLHTFELHHKNYQSLEKNIPLAKNQASLMKHKSISLKEFLAYYNSISISIDSDDYFEEILNNSWKLKRSFRDQLVNPAWVQEFSFEKNFSSPVRESSHIKKETAAPEAYQIKRREYYEKLKKKGSNRLASWASDSEQKKEKSTSPESVKPKRRPILAEVVDYSKKEPKCDEILLKFKNKLLSRGIRGITGTSKSFRICDKNRNFKIEFSEFDRLCKEYDIRLEENEIRLLFKKFDVDSSGDISYDEFLTCIIGKMNDFRVNLIKKAFDKIDSDHKGIIDINDIKKFFNAKLHPDVISGNVREDQVLKEFLEVFETNINKVSNIIILEKKRYSSGFQYFL